MGTDAEVKEVMASVANAAATGVIFFGCTVGGEADDDGLVEGLGVVSFLGVFDPFGDGDLTVGDDGEDAVVLDADIVGFVVVVGVLDEGNDLLH